MSDEQQHFDEQQQQQTLSTGAAVHLGLEMFMTGDDSDEDFEFSRQQSASAAGLLQQHQQQQQQQYQHYQQYSNTSHSSGIMLGSNPSAPLSVVAPPPQLQASALSLRGNTPQGQQQQHSNSAGTPGGSSSGGGGDGGLISRATSQGLLIGETRQHSSFSFQPHQPHPPQQPPQHQLSSGSPLTSGGLPAASVVTATPVPATIGTLSWQPQQSRPNSQQEQHRYESHDDDDQEQDDSVNLHSNGNSPVKRHAAAAATKKTSATVGTSHGLFPSMFAATEQAKPATQNQQQQFKPVLQHLVVPQGHFLHSVISDAVGCSPNPPLSQHNNNNIDFSNVVAASLGGNLHTVKTTRKMGTEMFLVGSHRGDCCCCSSTAGRCSACASGQYCPALSEMMPFPLLRSMVLHKPPLQHQQQQQTATESAGSGLGLGNVQTSSSGGLPSSHGSGPLPNHAPTPNLSLIKPVQLRLVGSNASNNNHHHHERNKQFESLLYSPRVEHRSALFFETGQPFPWDQQESDTPASSSRKNFANSNKNNNAILVPGEETIVIAVVGGAIITPLGFKQTVAPNNVVLITMPPLAPQQQQQQRSHTTTPTRSGGGGATLSSSQRQSSHQRVATCRIIEGTRFSTGSVPSPGSLSQTTSPVPLTAAAGDTATGSQFTHLSVCLVDTSSRATGLSLISLGVTCPSTTVASTVATSTEHFPCQLKLCALETGVWHDISFAGGSPASSSSPMQDLPLTLSVAPHELLQPATTTISEQPPPTNNSSSNSAGGVASKNRASPVPVVDALEAPSAAVMRSRSSSLTAAMGSSSGNLPAAAVGAFLPKSSSASAHGGGGGSNLNSYNPSAVVSPKQTMATTSAFSRQQQPQQSSVTSLLSYSEALRARCIPSLLEDIVGRATETATSLSSDDFLEQSSSSEGKPRHQQQQQHATAPSRRILLQHGDFCMTLSLRPTFPYAAPEEARKISGPIQQHSLMIPDSNGGLGGGGGGFAVASSRGMTGSESAANLMLLESARRPTQEFYAGSGDAASTSTTTDSPLYMMHRQHSTATTALPGSVVAAASSNSQNNQSSNTNTQQNNGGPAAASLVTLGNASFDSSKQHSTMSFVADSLQISPLAVTSTNRAGAALSSVSGGGNITNSSLRSGATAAAAITNQVKNGVTSLSINSLSGFVEFEVAVDFPKVEFVPAGGNNSNNTNNAAVLSQPSDTADASTTSHPASAAGSAAGKHQQHPHRSYTTTTSTSHAVVAAAATAASSSTTMSEAGTPESPAITLTAPSEDHIALAAAAQAAQTSFSAKSAAASRRASSASKHEQLQVPQHQQHLPVTLVPPGGLTAALEFNNLCVVGTMSSLHTAVIIDDTGMQRRTFSVPVVVRRALYAGFILQHQNAAAGASPPAFPSPRQHQHHHQSTPLSNGLGSTAIPMSLAAAAAVGAASTSSTIGGSKTPSPFSAPAPQQHQHAHHQNMEAVANSSLTTLQRFGSFASLAAAAAPAVLSFAVIHAQFIAPSMAERTTLRVPEVHPVSSSSQVTSRTHSFEATSTSQTASTMNNPASSNDGLGLLGAVAPSASWSSTNLQQQQQAQQRQNSTSSSLKLLSSPMLSITNDDGFNAVADEKNQKQDQQQQVEADKSESRDRAASIATTPGTAMSATSASLNSHPPPPPSSTTTATPPLSRSATFPPAPPPRQSQHQDPNDNSDLRDEVRDMRQELRDLRTYVEDQLGAMRELLETLVNRQQQQEQEQSSPSPTTTTTTRGHGSGSGSSPRNNG